MPSTQKLAYLLAALSALGPFAIDTYLPAQPAIAAALETDIHKVEQTMGLYMAGLAIGPLLGGPASDRFGRKLIAVIGLLFFAVSSFAIALCQTIDQMLLLRFLQAIGGGFAAVIGAATVRDFFSGREAARVMSMIGIIMMIAPLIAPAIGALLLTFLDWRAVFLWLGGYAVLIALLLWTKLPQKERTNNETAPKKLGFISVLSNYAEVISHRPTMLFILVQSFALSCMFMFLTESSNVYINYYEVEATLFPVLFGANIITMALFNRINLKLLQSNDPYNLLKVGVTVQSLGALALVIMVLLFEVPVWLFMMAVMIAVGAIGLIMANAVSCSLAYFPHISGAANAVISTCSYAMSAILALILTALHDGTPAPMAFMMFGCTLSALVILILFTTAPVVRS